MIKRSKLINKLENLLGKPVVRNSGLAIPELLKLAAVEIFYHCDEDNDLGETSYIIRLAMTELRNTGEIEFEKE